MDYRKTIETYIVERAKEVSPENLMELAERVDLQNLVEELQDEASEMELSLNQKMIEELMESSRMKQMQEQNLQKALGMIEMTKLQVQEIVRDSLLQKVNSLFTNDTTQTEE